MNIFFRRTMFLFCAKIMLALIACVSTAGCGLFWDDPYIAVSTNPLNWIEIHYYNATSEPVRRVSVRINGAGFAEIRNGTSRRVSDSFARDTADANWEDYRSRRITVDAKHVQAIFQDLVNQGLFDKDKVGRSTSKPLRGRFIAVRAAMDNRTYSEPKNIFEEDPELAERLLNIVLEFGSPSFQGSAQ